MLLLNIIILIFNALISYLKSNKMLFSPLKLNNGSPVLHDYPAYLEIRECLCLWVSVLNHFKSQPVLLQSFLNSLPINVYISKLHAVFSFNYIFFPCFTLLGSKYFFYLHFNDLVILNPNSL